MNLTIESYFHSSKSEKISINKSVKVDFNRNLSTGVNCYLENGFSRKIGIAFKGMVLANPDTTMDARQAFATIDEDLKNYNFEIPELISLGQEQIIKIDGNRSLSKKLTEINRVFPEFSKTINKKCGDGSNLAVHILKVTKNLVEDESYSQLSSEDKLLIKIAALFHDIEKDIPKAAFSDPAHPEKSAEFVHKSISRIDLEDEQTRKIVNIIKNHHWVANLEKKKKTLPTIASDFSTPENFKLGVMLTRADIKAGGTEKFINRFEKVYPKIIGQIYNQMRINNYPNDQQYRINLAKSIGCSPDSLMPVMGPDELRDRLKTLSPENFSAGLDLINKEKGIYKANLHMHTKASDGSFTPESLFKSLSEYSKTIVDPPFIVGVTDHDTLEGAQETIKYISEHPEDFENILVVPGIEFNAKFENPEYFKRPVQLEVLAYGINPFDEKLNEFIKDNKQEKLNIIRTIINEAENFGIETSLEEAREKYSPLRIPGGPCIDEALEKYLIKKGLNKEQVDVIFEKHSDKLIGKNLTSATPDVQDIINLNSNALISAAHPMRINFDNLLKTESNELDNSKTATAKALTLLLEDLKDMGVEAAEANYQPDSRFAWAEKEKFSNWASLISRNCDDIGLLKTGGMDNHGLSIFSRY